MIKKIFVYEELYKIFYITNENNNENNVILILKSQKSCKISGQAKIRTY